MRGKNRKQEGIKNGFNRSLKSYTRVLIPSHPRAPHLVLFWSFISTAQGDAPAAVDRDTPSKVDEKDKDKSSSDRSSESKSNSVAQSLAVAASVESGSGGDSDGSGRRSAPAEAVEGRAGAVNEGSPSSVDRKPQNAEQVQGQVQPRDVRAADKGGDDSFPGGDSAGKIGEERLLSQDRNMVGAVSGSGGEKRDDGAPSDGGWRDGVDAGRSGSASRIGGDGAGSGGNSAGGGVDSQSGSAGRDGGGGDYTGGNDWGSNYHNQEPYQQNQGGPRPDNGPEYDHQRWPADQPPREDFHFDDRGDGGRGGRGYYSQDGRSSGGYRGGGRFGGRSGGRGRGGQDWNSRPRRDGPGSVGAYGPPPPGGYEGPQQQQQYHSSNHPYHQHQQYYPNQKRRWNSREPRGDDGGHGYGQSQGERGPRSRHDSRNRSSGGGGYSGSGGGGSYRRGEEDSRHPGKRDRDYRDGKGRDDSRDGHRGWGRGHESERDGERREGDRGDRRDSRDRDGRRPRDR